VSSETLVHSDIDSGPVDAPIPIAPWPVTHVSGARDPFAATGVAEAVQAVVELARRTFGADGAGILLVADGTDGGTASAATSGFQARQADALQVDHHQGPGFQAIKGRQPVVSPDLRFDGRWRFWAPQAADLGLRSVLSLALVDGEPFGALTLYSRRPSFFHGDSLAPGLGFAHQAAAAITVAVEREQLLRAAESRGVVGQAQGILMERYEISAEQAFAVIKRSAAALDQKLRAIAEHITGDRSLVDLDLLARPHLLGAGGIGGGFDHDR
jgi:GAF domain-containing protein